MGGSQPEAIKGWVYGNAQCRTCFESNELFKQDTASQNLNQIIWRFVAASEMVKLKTAKKLALVQKIWTRSQIAAMSQSEFDKNEKHNRSYAEGRVINDMGNDQVEVL